MLRVVSERTAAHCREPFVSSRLVSATSTFHETPNTEEAEPLRFGACSGKEVNKIFDLVLQMQTNATNGQFDSARTEYTQTTVVLETHCRARKTHTEASARIDG